MQLKETVGIIYTQMLYVSLIVWCLTAPHSKSTNEIKREETGPYNSEVMAGC